MGAYYNETDPLKAEALREAIKAGAIAPGDVDERSIADVEPGDLVGYTQCHFFAGGGFWSLALRWAGWPDDRPVWTGSCPCPSFSAAGKGGGFDDPRHLWPHWDRLIDKSRPPVLFGEQADDAIGFGWLDLVQTDLEAKAYAVGSMVFGAHSVGAPHIRQRLYFVADTADGGRDGRWPGEEVRESRAQQQPERCGDVGECFCRCWRCAGGSHCVRCDGYRPGMPGRVEHAEGQRRDGRTHDSHGGRWQRTSGSAGAIGELAQSVRAAGERRAGGLPGAQAPVDSARLIHGSIADGFADGREDSRANPLNGYWRDADWIGCRDGKFRPVEPGTFPLAHGSPARVGRLRLYGDGIVVTQAQAFIESYLDLEVL